MKKSVFAALFATLAFSSAFAADSDLTLPGERWLAQFTGYVCDDGNTPTSSVPAEFAAHNVQLGRTTTDFSLDNLLVKGTFEQDGVACNYSVLLLADNAAWTIKMVESKAYAPNGGSDCAQGKAFLDTVFKDNKYKYLHGRAAIYVPAPDAVAQCGAGATAVGLHFQVKGKIQ